MKKFSLPFVLLAGLLTGNLGPSTNARAQVLHFEHFPDVSPWIFDLHQDREGFLWIGSGDGLYRYDGHNFRRYINIPGDSTSLSGSNIKIIFEDRSGTLWVGTDLSSGGAGLNRYSRETDTFSRFVNNPNDPTSIDASPVTAIHEDRRGIFWVGTNGGGLYRFDRETGIFNRHPYDRHNPENPGGNTVNTIFEDRAGSLWVSSPGLGRYDRESDSFTPFRHDPDDESSIASEWVTAMLEDRNGRFWIGTSDRGLCLMNRQKSNFSCHQHDPDDLTSLSDNRVSSIHEDASGMLWVGTTVSTGEGGLNRFDPETGTFYRLLHDPSKPTNLNNNNVETILQDRSGVLWIGTFGGGLNKLKHPTPLFTAYLPTAPDLQAWSIMEDRAGRLWVTSGIGIHRLDRTTGRWTSFLHDPDDPTSLSRGIFRAVYEDRSGVLWVGTGDGLDRLDSGTGSFKHFRHDPDDPTTISNSTIKSIYEDRQGRLWVGTWSDDGLNLMDRQTGTFTRFKHDPRDPLSIGPGVVNNMLEDSRGRFWIATSAGGLNLMDRETGRFTRFVHDPENPNSLSSNDVNPLLEDRDGLIWAGTFGNGMNRFDPESGRSRRFNTLNSCLPHDLVFGILQDQNGYLWLNTNQGIVRFDPQQETCTVYGTQDGLASLATAPGSFKSARGEMLFGSFGGVHGFSPEAMPVNAEPPPVVLTDFRLFNRSIIPGAKSVLKRRVTEADEIVLAHTQNSIGFEFAALHFTRPDQNRYAYRLEGFDEDWVHAAAVNTATYTNLSPGSYVFRVKAANSDGLWNEEGASIKLTIRTPWWRGKWAYLAYGLLAALCVLAADRFQRRRVIRKERERARELELEQAREIEVMNVRLREHESHLESQNAVLEAHKTQLEEQKRVLVELDIQKSRFFANISHEIRTPLTLILGPLSDALQGDFEEGCLPTQVPMMHRNARRLLKLINQLLDFSRLEAGAMQLNVRRLDLVAFLREIFLSFSARAERGGIALSFTAEAECIPFVFDPDKLEKVIANLLSNAFKFTPCGGKIRISVAEDNGHVEVNVKDTGRGIPKEELQYVFDRFYQVDGSAVREHEGSGIGLALSKELVELHGGEITVQSELGFGTTLQLRLPPIEMDYQAAGSRSDPIDTFGWKTEEQRTDEDVADWEDATLWDGDSSRQAPPKDAMMVLLVDDNPDVRAYIRSLLCRRYRIEEAFDGYDGLEATQRLRPDLVIADVMMPRLDGLDLCRAIKTDPELSHIPVVLLTAKAEEEGKLVGLKTGADDYLMKPFSAHELRVRVENLIELRRLLRQRFSGQVRIEPSQVSVTSADAAFLERVRETFETHIGESDFGVERLADEVGLSRRHFHRRMKHLIHLSPAGYIRMMRLERSAQLLEQRAGNVSEIAHAVGFKDASYFARIFSQSFGVTPSEYPIKR